jgi:hypothetical protein
LGRRDRNEGVVILNALEFQGSKVWHGRDEIYDMYVSFCNILCEKSERTKLALLHNYDNNIIVLVTHYIAH